MPRTALHYQGGFLIPERRHNAVVNWLQFGETELYDDFIDGYHFQVYPFRSLSPEAYGSLPEKDPETIYCIQDAQ